MAKFRRGHMTQKRSGIRLTTVLFGAGLVIMSLFLIRHVVPSFYPINEIAFVPEQLDYLPAANDCQLVHHQYYSLCYTEKHEQASWVAYELTRSELKAPRVSRTDWFYPDYSVSTRSAFHRDYSNSGYSRGHLAPAADMAFDSVAMRESFYMSNISPQLSAFNQGIWRELEELTRDWARASGRLFVIAGPVLTDGITERIGQNKVGVPPAFYKVLLAPDREENNSIAFVIPNALSETPVMNFAVSIDSAEVITGIDFFPEIPGVTDESVFDIARWPVDQVRFRLRVQEWNHR